MAFVNFQIPIQWMFVPKDNYFVEEYLSTTQFPNEGVVESEEETVERNATKCTKGDDVHVDGEHNISKQCVERNEASVITVVDANSSFVDEIECDSDDTTETINNSEIDKPVVIETFVGKGDKKILKYSNGLYSGKPNHFLKSTFLKDKQLKLVDVFADGNSLYSTLAYFVDTTKNLSLSFKVVKKTILHSMKSFVKATEHKDDYPSVKTIASRMQDGIPGTADEIEWFTKLTLAKVTLFEFSSDNNTITPKVFEPPTTTNEQFTENIPEAVNNMMTMAGSEFNVIYFKDVQYKPLIGASKK